MRRLFRHDAWNTRETIVAYAGSIIVAMVVGYLLSSGPGCRAAVRSPKMRSGLTKFYWPVINCAARNDGCFGRVSSGYILLFVKDEDLDDLIIESLLSTLDSKGELRKTADAVDDPIKRKRKDSAHTEAPRIKR